MIAGMTHLHDVSMQCEAIVRFERVTETLLNLMDTTTNVNCASAGTKTPKTATKVQTILTSWTLLVYGGLAMPLCLAVGKRPVSAL